MPVFALNSRAARAAIDGTQAALRSPASPWWSWPELDAYRRAARAPLARTLFRRQDVAGAHACVPSRLPSVYPRRRAAGRRASFRLSLGQLPFRCQAMPDGHLHASFGRLTSPHIISARYFTSQNRRLIPEDPGSSPLYYIRSTGTRGVAGSFPFMWRRALSWDYMDRFGRTDVSFSFWDLLDAYPAEVIDIGACAPHASLQDISRSFRFHSSPTL